MIWMVSEEGWRAKATKDPEKGWRTGGGDRFGMDGMCGGDQLREGTPGAQRPRMKDQGRVICQSRPPCARGGWVDGRDLRTIARPPATVAALRHGLLWKHNVVVFDVALYSGVPPSV